MVRKTKTNTYIRPHKKETLKVLVSNGVEFDSGVDHS